MTKYLVNWKFIASKNMYGESYNSEFPRLIDHVSKKTLLAKILTMPKKIPIHLEDAARIAEEKYFSSDIGYERGQNFWFAKNFVEYISELGYHIELTGDEFEVLHPSQATN
jgi:hypothetical protein